MGIEYSLSCPQGGDGTAEDRFLLTLADLSDQLRWQARQILDRRDYGLFLHYSPILDDATHTWGGYLDPTMPGHDPELAAALWPKLVAAFRLHEPLLGDVLDAAERDGAHVILVSDHGMGVTSGSFLPPCGSTSRSSVPGFSTAPPEGASTSHAPGRFCYPRRMPAWRSTRPTGPAESSPRKTGRRCSRRSATHWRTCETPPPANGW